MPPRFRYLSFALCASTLLLSPLGRAQQPAATNAPSSTPTAPTGAASSTSISAIDAAQKAITDAVQKMNAKIPDMDGALNDLNQALKLNPDSTGAYVLRASIYCQKKQWDLAENDFRSAARIAPTNSVLKFNLVEIKFMQKEYDVARPGFVALESDPDMGDFASYKVFLCDLFGGHEDAAKKELDAFNDAAENPSYYFSNAAWDLVHKNIDDARGWLVSASNIYPPRKNAYYAQSLRDLGYLPIPAPGDKVTPPPAAGNP
jgi:tetratricopeptide (TPR) repeat protein